jgi:hypothetical protein
MPLAAGSEKNLPIIAAEIAAGFAAVEKGRRPDVVLQEVISRIKERTCQSVEPTPAKTADTSSKLN